MTTLYFDPFSGIAGNMVVGALLDAGADPERLRRALASIPFPEGPLGLIIEKRTRKAIAGTYFNTVEDHASGPNPGFAHDGRIQVGLKPQQGGAVTSDIQAPGRSPEHDHPVDRDQDTHDYAGHHDHPASPQHHGHELPFLDPRDHGHGGHGHDHGHGHDGHIHIHSDDHGEPHDDGPAHEHRGLVEIRALLAPADLRPAARDFAEKLFVALAEAEARVHGKAIDEVKFHEVGARDSIADLVGAAVCLDDLGVTSAFTGPVHVGSGFVKCQHGVLPIPAPATAYLLVGLPIFCLPGVVGELTTPTGAAVLRGTGARPGLPPGFAPRSIGFGHGTMNFPMPNSLRVFVGDGAASGRTLETVAVLETHLDNVTGELLGHVVEKLMTRGALDVTLTPMIMKKGRPAQLLTVIARCESIDDLETAIYEELPTLGIRRQFVLRSVLPRLGIEIATPEGPFPGKRVVDIDGTATDTLEFDARCGLAAKRGVPVRRVRDDK